MKRALVLLALLFPLTLVAQQQSDRALLDSLFKVKQLRQTAISPDGKLVAWSIREGGGWVAPLSGGEPHRLGTGQVFHFAWSPDSKRIAYLASTGKMQRQVFVAIPGEDPTKLTEVKGFLDEPAWSPDGKSIAFLFIENAKREAGPLVAMSRDEGVVEEHILEQRIALVDVASGKLRIVTPADMYVYHFDWSPDSKRIAAEAAPGSGDNNYWIAQLHVVDVAAATMKSIYKPKLQIADPRWSSDGKQIAFIEGLMSDEGSTGGDLMVVDADGSNAVNVTPNMSASATSIVRVNPFFIDFVANEKGESTIFRRTDNHGSGWLGPDTLDRLWHGSESVSSVSLTPDGKSAAVIRSSFNQPPEVFAGPIGTWKQITHVNDAVHSEVGQVKSLTWKSDEFDVQGWLLFPRDYDPAKKYPMVVWAHGGPAGVATNRWPSETAVLLSRHGFFSFFPNPRGSYGQGERFTQGNVKDFGYGDLRDIMRGIDTVLRDYPVDGNRLGIWGWSYGGYMTMWAVTQTNLFHAAVAGAGLSNWQSYYGQNDIDQWMIPYFGASVYDDPAVYAKSSPITFVKNVKTPTLIVVGERDGEVPAPQSYEFWHALKTLGVETQLVVYPDEGHRFVQLEHRRDVAMRMVGWFVEHLK
jgi:dipeptidyl aminopeptidase/acylaminoacyl peptidase